MPAFHSPGQAASLVAFRSWKGWEVAYLYGFQLRFGHWFSHWIALLLRSFQAWTTFEFWHKKSDLGAKSGFFCLRLFPPLSANFYSLRLCSASTECLLSSRMAPDSRDLRPFGLSPAKLWAQAWCRHFRHSWDPAQIGRHQTASSRKSRVHRCWSTRLLPLLGLAPWSWSASPWPAVSATGLCW